MIINSKCTNPQQNTCTGTHLYLFLAFRRLRQADLYEFKVSLVYIESSKPVSLFKKLKPIHIIVKFPQRKNILKLIRKEGWIIGVWRDGSVVKSMYYSC